jgi:serine/threonine protein kinase/tetratricopeptide (TPR) repeat protein
MSSLSGRQNDKDPAPPLPSTATANTARFRDSIVDEFAAETLGDMAAAWHAGARTPAEEWLRRRPDLAARTDVAVRVIYEEICLREELNETVESDEFYRRFPQWREALEVVFECHRLVDAPPPPVRFPNSGERLGDLELLCELGRGAVGRVFLATQPALSDRPLVVKLTPPEGAEHLSLARLQHTHIAPLYLVQDFPDEHLRALCMPFLGGTSWARLLDDLKVWVPRERSGRQIVDALGQAQRELPLHTHSGEGPGIRFLNRASYVQAVAWIGSCLADALHYAHQRGLVHLDIKPSNVLLTADGQPMLLDFHLAREEVPPGSPLERLGGTSGYMSYEQQQATAAVREGRPLSMALDGRSDVYSLGALLYESLAGGLPPADESTSRRRLRQVNPSVSRGLEDVVHKCLARIPAARYHDAGQLATDLRRHLADLPLSGVPNRSVIERWQKWRRRRPLALALAATTLAAIVVIGGVALVLGSERQREARLALAQGRQSLENRDYTPAIEQFEAGWRAVRWLPGQVDLKQALQTQLSAAKKARLAFRLHQLVEQLRFVDAAPRVPAAKLAELQSGCAKIWQARHQFTQPPEASGDSEPERLVRADLTDLAVLWAELQVRAAPPNEVEGARRQAVALLDEAQSLCGSSPILDLARAAYSERSAASPAGPGQLVAKSSGERFAVGRYLFRAGKFKEAEREFRQAIDQEPDAFWPNFYLAQCAYRLESFDEALTAATVCVALRPTSAECFYNRALAHQALRQHDEALEDFTRALKLDPSLAVAVLGRGMLLAGLKRYDEALADFELALERGADPAETNYQIAGVQFEQGDRRSALESLERALEHDPNFEPAAALKKRWEQRR